MNKGNDETGWKYPLTNVRLCGRGRKPKPTAIVSDAEGKVLLTFLGLPYRRNRDAVVMATGFCWEMNIMHGKETDNGK